MEKNRSEKNTQTILSSNAVYESIIGALTEDYFDLYYVDVETGQYIEYGAVDEEGQKRRERQGEDFFAECKEKALRYIYEEDLGGITEALDKDRLLGKIKKHGFFTTNYRLLIGGVPTYVNMKATRAGDGRYIIIGVSNVDTQVKDRLAAERAEEERKSYQRLSALNGNMLVLYYVNLEDDSYTEFSAADEFKNLGIAEQGTDFFSSTYENSLRVIHPEDIPLFRAQFTKENILATIKQDGVFMLYYRLLIGELPSYVRLKAAKIEEEGTAYLIIGLFDEDAQIRREQEYTQNLSVARKMATVDSLTGIKNKHAYVELEEKVNEEIKRGEAEPFAIVVCDVNNLKAVNDLYGHKEGDNCIKKACSRICNIYSHSPAFRIGGDEFVVYLSGADYYRRKELLEEINAVSKDPSKIRIGETISAGMAEYVKDKHQTVLSVFEEADSAMYQRKQYMKEYVLPKEKHVGGSPYAEYIPVIHSRKGILIADDMEINRSILGNFLSDEYDIFFASDGLEALEVLHEHKDEIDLLLLDLKMPNKDGKEVIQEMQVDEDLMSVPIIVFTVDEAAELDCLRSGVMDFIPKPYPDIEIVKARIAKCIELSEDRELIRYTERDKLTGLLNRDYFFRYVRRLDNIHKDGPMDAIACDVNSFHSANRLYGREFCDVVLRTIGSCLRRVARDTGGISCRERGDTFLFYCPHQENFEETLKSLLSEAFKENEIDGKVSVRIGVFTDARQTADIEERFEQAKAEADKKKEHRQD